MSRRLDRFVTERTHDGVVLDMGRYSPEGARRAGVTGMMLYAAAGPLTLGLLGLPGAALVEASGWWLVNEAVLIQRWLLYGTLVGLGLVALAWFTWFAPPQQRIEVGMRHLVVTHRRLGRVTWRARVPMEQIRGVRERAGAAHAVVQVEHDRGRLPIPITDRKVPAGALVELIGQLAEEARRKGDLGTASEVPRALRELLRQRS